MTTLDIRFRIHLDGSVALFGLKYHIFVLSITFFMLIINFDIRKLSDIELLRQIKSVHQSISKLLVIEKGILAD